MLVFHSEKQVSYQAFVTKLITTGGVTEWAESKENASRLEAKGHMEQMIYI